MSKMIRIKRGLDAARASYVLQLGELVWSTDTQMLYIGDGITSGGIRVTGAIEDLFILNSEKAVANGVATLGPDGKIPDSQVPALAITETFVVSSEPEQVNLAAQEGDVAIRTDLNLTYIKGRTTSGTMADWIQMAVPTDAVTSVNGHQGTVVLDLGSLSNVDLSALQPNDLLQWDSTTSTWLPVDSSLIGRTLFTALDDTPSSYAGNGGNLLIVEPGETGVAFTNTIDGGVYNGAPAPTVPIPTPTMPSTVKFAGPRPLSRVDNSPTRKSARARRIKR